MKKYFLYLVITLCIYAPTAYALPGDSCAFNGTQPGVLDANERCVLDAPVCDPATQNCNAAGCDPTESSCEQVAPPPPSSIRGGSSQSSGFVALAPIPGLTDSSNTSVVNSTGFAQFFNNLYKYLIGLAAIFAIMMIIWGGLRIATNYDSVSKLMDAKGDVLRAIQGLILVLAPVLVFSIINPSILNLSINMPPIDLKTTGDNNGGGNSNTLPPAPATGCTKSQNSGQYFETHVCTTRKDALADSCGNGLDLIIPIPKDCKVKDQSGKCLDDQSVVTYCQGKNITLTYYSFYTTYLLIQTILAGSPAWIPADQNKADEFKSGCQANGGVIQDELTAAAKVYLATQVFHAYNNCPADFTYQIDTDKYSGVVCYGNVRSCMRPDYDGGGYMPK